MEKDTVLNDLYQVVKSKQTIKEEGSYTSYLFEQGIDKILKKCGEECSEVIIAAKNNNKENIVGELADLFYHLTVLMVECGIAMDDVLKELEKRSHKLGNLKKMKTVDKNT